MDYTIDIENCYRRYGPMVFRRCQRLLGDSRKAEDAMQDVFVQLLIGQDRLRAQALSSLLYLIATRICLNMIRSEKRHPENPESDLLHRIALSLDAEQNSMARLLIGKLFQKEPISTQVMATLHLLDGLTLEEVARETGLSISGVRKRLRKIKHKLWELEEGV